MGGSSDAGAASLRRSVVSLTNGPSIMILGRLGVSRPGSVAPDPFASLRDSIIVHDSTRIYARFSPGSSHLSASAAPFGSLRRDNIERGSTREGAMLSLGEAESPHPGQVYVTSQATSG